MSEWKHKCPHCGYDSGSTHRHGMVVRCGRIYVREANGALKWRLVRRKESEVPEPPSYSWSPKTKKAVTRKQQDAICAAWRYQRGAASDMPGHATPVSATTGGEDGAVAADSMYELPEEVQEELEEEERLAEESIRIENKFIWRESRRRDKGPPRIERVKLSELRGVAVQGQWHKKLVCVDEPKDPSGGWGWCESELRSVGARWITRQPINAHVVVCLRPVREEVIRDARYRGKFVYIVVPDWDDMAVPK